MIKRVLGIVFLSATPLFSDAQTLEEIRSRKDIYLYGEGRASTLNEADKLALSMLINQISVNVTSIVQYERTEENGSLSEELKTLIETYSSSTLRNTERIIIADEPNAHVIRYIKRQSIHQIFEDRKNKIIEFFNYASKHETNNEYAYALKYYYWALVLLSSHPNKASISVPFQSNSTTLNSLIHTKMNQIFDKINISVHHSVDKGNYIAHTLIFDVDGHKASNLDFHYWTGRDWVGPFSAKNGLALIELPNNSFEKCRIKIEYEYKHESNYDYELKQILNSIEPPSFPKSSLSVDLEDYELNMKDDGYYGISIADISQHSYVTTLNEIIASIQSGDYNNIDHYFTTDGLKKIEQILQYGNAQILSTENISFYSTSTGTVCRSIPMAFSFRNNNIRFTEELVFSFNKQGLIDNVAFALSDIAISDISKMKEWAEPIKIHLITFLENYKTAYALKNLDYIQSIFSDDALIIVGTVIKKFDSKTEFENEVIRFNHFSKQEYIQRLLYTFNSKEYINIRFEELTVRKAGNGQEVYGVQIKQKYFSSNYGDTGYLFLLLNFNNASEPIINVRTWQPNKSEDGSIYGLEDF